MSRYVRVDKRSVSASVHKPSVRRNPSAATRSIVLRQDRKAAVSRIEPVFLLNTSHHETKQ